MGYIGRFLTSRLFSADRRPSPAKSQFAHPEEPPGDFPRCMQVTPHVRIRMTTQPCTPHTEPGSRHCSSSLTRSAIVIQRVRTADNWDRNCFRSGFPGLGISQSKCLISTMSIQAPHDVRRAFKKWEEYVRSVVIRIRPPVRWAYQQVRPIS